LFNSLGQAVDVLVNSVQSAGKYEAVWNAEKYPSGVYFYKLEAGVYTEIKKMILLR
jgi:hypothetical protein